jgi:hypothetical protein
MDRRRCCVVVWLLACSVLTAAFKEQDFKVSWQSTVIKPSRRPLQRELECKPICLMLEGFFMQLQIGWGLGAVYMPTDLLSAQYNVRPVYAKCLPPAEM